MSAIISDSLGVVIWANASFTRLTGYQYDEIVGRKTELFEPMSGMPSGRAPLGHPGWGEAWEGEFALRRKSGETRIVWNAVTPVLDAAGSATYALWIMADWTRAEEALPATAERYSAIFSTMSEGVVFQAADGRIEACNPSAERILGLTADQMAGLTSVDPRWAAIHEDGSPFAGETHPSMETLRTGQPLTNVIMGVHKPDGALTWISINSRPLSRNGDLPYAVLATFVDITERKAVEDALREKNDAIAEAGRHYHVLFNSGSDAAFVFRLEPDGLSSRFLNVNDHACRLLGYTRDELLQLRVADVHVEDQHSSSSALMEQLTKEGRVVRERWLRTKDGRSIPVELSTQEFDLDGTRIGISHARDISERILVRERLRKSEEKFAKAFLSSPAPTVLFKPGPDGNRLIDVNEALEQHSGYRRDEVIGKTSAELRTWVDAFERAAVWKRFLADGTIRNFETTLRRKDGEIRICLVSADWIEIDGERCVIETVVDITERKRAEEALRASNAAVAEAERRYRQLFNSVSDAVSVHRVEEDGTLGRFLDLNESACRLYGYSREQLLQMEPADLILTAELPAVPKNTLRLLIDGVLTWTGTLVAKDGRHIPVEVNTQVFAFDGSRSAISSVRDVSQRVEAERRYQDIFDGALEGLYQGSVDATKMSVNPAYARMLGYESPDECVADLIGRKRQVWMDPADRERVIAAGLEHGFVRDYECQLVRRDGTPIWVSFNVRLIRDQEGQPLYTEGFIADISQRKLSGAENAKLAERLREAEKLESVGRLAGGVAHEFNNLLTVINGYAEFLLKELPPADPLHSYAKSIATAGKRAASLAQQLLAFGRKQIFQRRVLNLNVTVHSFTRMVHRLIGENITLVTHPDASLAHVMADSVQLEQMLVNLVLNARDAMPEGGRLEVGTENVEVDAEGAAAIDPEAPAGRYVLLTVRDTGRGMDEQTRQRAFEPFFTTKGVGEGTGLGLSTVHGIVRQSGGWILIESAVGIGTTVKVYLPGLDEVSQPEAKVTRTATRASNGTILIVEDERAVRKFTATVLKHSGYEVLEASNGEEAIAAAELRTGQIDVLLTDVVLPGMNGKKVYDSLRALHPDLLAIFMSGYPRDVIGQSGLLDQNTLFLQKPFNADDLAERVREVLAMRLS